MNRRREWIRMMAASGALGVAGVAGIVARALAKGDLPPGVHQIEGMASVNGRPAHVGTPILMGDRVSTARASQAIIVIGSDAMLLRAQTTIEVKGREGVLSEMLITTGKVLSVFSKKPVAIRAASASIGIRGTGAYVEVDPGSVYFCLCYGEALVEGPGMAAGKRVTTTHHEEPLLLSETGGILRAEPGPFRNHSDAELIMLEALVGREPPFMKGGTYPAKQY
jgi:hypothetical protein